MAQRKYNVGDRWTSRMGYVYEITDAEHYGHTTGLTIAITHPTRQRSKRPQILHTNTHRWTRQIKAWRMKKEN